MWLTRGSTPNSRIFPTPGARATCPQCGGLVQAKCGRIVTWHWAHLGAECDTWAEPETAWHRTWQAIAPVERREVVIGNHRADLLTIDRVVIELQHSSISVDEIEAREAHYGKRMCWLFDATGARLEERLDIRNPGKADQPRYRTFRWKHPRKSLAACRRTVLLDLGQQEVLRLGRIYTDAPCGGWGEMFARAEIETWIRAGSP